MENAEHQHFAWLARSFGRTDYLPLSPDDLDALSGAGEYVEKYPGTHLFKQGAPATAAYVIQRGQVELYRTRNEGRRVVGRIGEGGVIGDIAMFQNQPYISSAKAIGPVVAYKLDRQKADSHAARTSDDRDALARCRLVTTRGNAAQGSTPHASHRA